MRIYLLFLICLFASAFAANTLSGTSYSFVKPNSKNYVYTGKETPIMVTVDVTSWDAQGFLNLNFFTESGDSLSLISISACVDANNVEVFSPADGSLYTENAITSATTCSFSATIYPDCAGKVYTKLSVAAGDNLSVPSFTTADSSVQGRWQYFLPGVGDMTTLKPYLPERRHVRHHSEQWRSLHGFHGLSRCRE